MQMRELPGCLKRTGSQIVSTTREVDESAARKFPRVPGTSRLGNIIQRCKFITLNCVSPDERFRDLSRDLLAAPEVRAVERGDAGCTLTGTETARRFSPAETIRHPGNSVRRLGPHWRNGTHDICGGSSSRNVPAMRPNMSSFAHIGARRSAYVAKHQ
jgi:hypothetical protein